MNHQGCGLSDLDSDAINHFLLPSPNHHLDDGGSGGVSGAFHLYLCHLMFYFCWRSGYPALQFHNLLIPWHFPYSMFPFTVFDLFQSTLSVFSLRFPYPSTVDCLPLAHWSGLAAQEAVGKWYTGNRSGDAGWCDWVLDMILDGFLSSLPLPLLFNFTVAVYQVGSKLYAMYVWYGENRSPVFDHLVYFSIRVVDWLIDWLIVL